MHFSFNVAVSLFLNGSSGSGKKFKSKTMLAPRPQSFPLLLSLAIAALLLSSGWCDEEERLVVTDAEGNQEDAAVAAAAPDPEVDEGPSAADRTSLFMSFMQATGVKSNVTVAYEGVDDANNPMSTGRRVMANVDIKEGDLLLEMPVSQILAKATAVKTLGEEVVADLPNDAHLLLAVLLLKERSQAEQSTIYAYLNWLPKTWSTTSYYDEADMEELRGTQLFVETQQRIRGILMSHAELVEPLVNKHKLLTNETFTPRDLLWALSTVWAESVFMNVDNAVQPVLLPIVGRWGGG